MLEVAIASMKAAKAGPNAYKQELDPGVYAYNAKDDEKEDGKEKEGASA